MLRIATGLRRQRSRVATKSLYAVAARASVLVCLAVPTLIHRDSDLLIVHKPSGLPTTAPSADERCLVRWVKEQFPELRAHPTSRLDSPVSGLVTFTLNKSANQRILEARRAGSYERLYLGITLHPPDDDHGAWSWPISIDPSNPKLRIAGEGRGEREARTRFEVHARAPHAALLHLMPETGRTHQLRVHCAEAGASLFGDHAYAGERRSSLPDGSVVSARRVMLHCTRVGFPWGREFRRFEAPAPDDMQRVWSALGGASAQLAG